MDPMEATWVDLADYVHSGEGVNGVSYDHRTDPSVMIKMYPPEKLRQALDELSLARKVYAAGIPTPEPGDLVTDGRRYGIRFTRIPDKLSYARAVSLHPEETERYAEEFAALSRSLHATRVDTSVFEGIKDRYLRELADNPFFSTVEKERLVRFIENVPDTDTALHGDLQFGNVIFSGDRRYFIDLGDFCYGAPLFDIGMVYATAYLSDPGFVRESFHMEQSQALRFWKAFAPAYFGKDRPLRDIEDEVRPFAGLKTIIVERDMGVPFPSFHSALQPILHP